MVIGGRRFWQVAVLVLAAAAFGSAGCETTPPEEGIPGLQPRPPTGPHAALLRMFPTGKDVADWEPADDEIAVYGLTADPAAGVEPLDKDLGPAAAVYRGYALVKSGACRYVRGRPGETVAVRIFEMESPSEAFGIFSVQSRGTKFPTLGSAARLTSKTLGFVKGRYFVSAEYAGPGEATSVLMEFGRWIADQISSRGYQPAILKSFPVRSVQGERYYLHTFETLMLLGPVPKSNPAALRRALKLGPQTDVAVMGYATAAGALNYVFVIRYPSADEAAAAYKAYGEYLESSADPAEQNVALAPPVRMYLAGTLNAEENSIRDRLAELLAGLGA